MRKKTWISRHLHPAPPLRSWVLAILLLAGCVVDRPAARLDTPSGEGELVIELSGFRNDRGKALVGLFATADGFPVDASRTLSNGEATIVDGRASVTFSQVPWGRYAVGVLHDENGNGRMDTGALGIPEEGHGASNNIARRFGAPPFDEAAFVFDQPQQRLHIDIRYVVRGGPFKR